MHFSHKRKKNLHIFLSSEAKIKPNHGYNVERNSLMNKQKSHRISYLFLFFDGQMFDRSKKKNNNEILLVTPGISLMTKFKVNATHNQFSPQIDRF